MGRTSKSSNASSTAQEHDSDPTEFVSMATFNEMMKMQERMLKTMFESVLSSVNTRIDEVVKSKLVFNIHNGTLMTLWSRLTN